MISVNGWVLNAFNYLKGTWVNHYNSMQPNNKRLKIEILLALQERSQVNHIKDKMSHNMNNRFTG